MTKSVNDNYWCFLPKFNFLLLSHFKFNEESVQLSNDFPERNNRFKRRKKRHGTAYIHALIQGFTLRRRFSHGGVNTIRR